MAVYEIIDDERYRTLYMVTEYLSKGHLKWESTQRRPKMGLIPVIPISTARKYFIDLLSAIEYLHSKDIIHCDIRPHNFLISKKNDLKIFSFNSFFLKNNDDEENNKNFNISLKTSDEMRFMAPELCVDYYNHVNQSNDLYNTYVNSNNSNQSIGLKIRRFENPEAIDIWSLGVTLYCFVFGRYPFLARNKFDLARQIVTEPVRFPTQYRINHDINNAIDLISKIMKKDPKKRITLSDIRLHPFVVNLTMDENRANEHIHSESLDTAIQKRSNSIIAKKGLSKLHRKVNHLLGFGVDVHITTEKAEEIEKEIQLEEIQRIEKQKKLATEKMKHQIHLVKSAEGINDHGNHNHIHNTNHNHNYHLKNLVTISTPELRSIISTRKHKIDVKHIHNPQIQNSCINLNGIGDYSIDRNRDSYGIRSITSSSIESTFSSETDTYSSDEQYYKRNYL